MCPLFNCNEVVRLVASLLIVVFMGWSVLFLIIRKDRSFAVSEKLALSYCIGLGVLTVQMFFYSLMGIQFSPTLIFAPYIVVALASVAIYAKVKPTGQVVAVERNGTIERLLTGGIAIQVFHAFFKALIKPMDSFDSIGNFAFKAKLFFFQRYIPYELFAKKSMDIQHPDYPLLLPLSETWVALFLRRWNDVLIKTLFPLFFVAMLIILYFCLRRFTGKRIALSATFLLATIPHFVNYATIGYADFALALFASASFFYAFIWITRMRQRRYLVLAAFLAVFSVWTKHEGVMFAFIMMFLLLLFAFFAREKLPPSGRGDIILFSVIVSVFVALWFGFLHVRGISNEFVNKETLNLSVLVNNTGRIPLILYEYQKHIFGPKKWNISLLVFFAGLIIYHKKAFKTDLKYATWYILLSLSGYTLVYLITPLEIRYHLQTTGSRLLLHFLPVVLFCIGYAAKEIFNAEDNIP